jgi:hypothetical protein
MSIPYVTIVDLSRVKISDEDGFDIANLTFSFDIRVVEYVVRCNGTDAFTGIKCGSANKYVITHSEKTIVEMANETVIDVSSFPANTNFTVEIDYTELYSEGENRLNVYGLGADADRDWTPYNQI